MPMAIPRVPSFSDLLAHLKELATEAPLVALKSGTEVEDMGFDEIGLLRRLSDDIVPLYVKLGGAEARNDIRNLAELGVDGIIAPMIESPYALQKFVETLQELLAPQQYRSLLRGINLETICAVQNLESILQSRHIEEIQQVTAARSDLSSSMQLEPDHPQVVEMCARIVEAAGRRGLRTSVGGGIHPPIAPALLRQVGADLINTRHILISCRASSPSMPQDLLQVVNRCLHFELRLYQHLAEQTSRRQEHYRSRIAAISERIGYSPTKAL